MKLYAVSAGSYSDYSVEQIFSTREGAQKYIDISNDMCPGDFNDIEEYELDPEIKVPYHKYKYFYNVRMLRDGTISSLKEPSDVEWLIRKEEVDILHPEEKKEITTFSWSWYTSDGRAGGRKDDDVLGVELVCSINADSVDHAVKLAGEKRHRLIRQDLWPKNKQHMYDIINSAYRKYGKHYDIIKFLESGAPITHES